VPATGAAPDLFPPATGAAPTPPLRRPAPHPNPPPATSVRPTHPPPATARPGISDSPAAALPRFPPPPTSLDFSRWRRILSIVTALRRGPPRVASPPSTRCPSSPPRIPLSPALVAPAPATGADVASPLRLSPTVHGRYIFHGRPADELSRGLYLFCHGARTSLTFLFSDPQFPFSFCSGFL
jgi:hypothetical protein